MRFAVAGLGLVALASLWVAPLASSQEPPSNPSGDVAGRLEFSADSKECLQHASWGPEVTCTVLYGHIYDLLRKGPMNVQFPDAVCPDLARGFTTVPTVEPQFNQNQLEFFSSPGFVEYESGTRTPEGCDPYIHPEVGLTDNVAFASDIPLTFYWYLSADTDDVSVAADPEELDTGAMPCVTVRVTLQEGRHWRQGPVIAEGFATRTVASTKAGESAVLPIDDPCAAGDLVLRDHAKLEVAPVHEFPSSLGAVAEGFSKVQGYMVHVEWWQVDELGEEQKVAQREWNVHTGVGNRARLVLPVLNPARVEEVRPQLFLGTIYIHGVFNSPWGSYDVDPASLEVEILDGTGTPISAPALGEPILVYDTSHKSHFRPVNMTVPWDFLADKLVPGTYTIRMSGQNWQHSATASNEARVELPFGYDHRLSRVEAYSSDDVRQRNILRHNGAAGPSGSPTENDSPAVGIPALVALAGVAAAAVRTVRRSNP